MGLTKFIRKIHRWIVRVTSQNQSRAWVKMFGDTKLLPAGRA